MESGAVQTETRLIEQAAAGDAAAFGEIYTRHLNAIYRYIFFRVGDTHDAEDLTETVFLKAWQAIPQYRDMGIKFSNWLYRIAHNAIIDFRRKRQLEPGIDMSETNDEVNLPESLLQQVNEMEEASALAQAIANLTDEQQQIILLRFVEGMSHGEIAQIMQKSEGACRMLQNRAIVALYQQLQAA